MSLASMQQVSPELMTGGFAPSQWAQSMGLGDLERMVNNNSLTPEARRYLEANLGYGIDWNQTSGQEAWNEFVRRTQDNGSASPFNLTNLAKIVGGTAGFGVGGTTGADIGQNVASGQSPSNVDFGRDLTADAAGLAAGAGLSSALPALGLSTPTAATTVAGAAGAGTGVDAGAFLPGAAGAEVPAAAMGPEAFLPGSVAAPATAPATAAAGGTVGSVVSPAAAGATGTAGTAAAAGAGGIGATKLSDVLSGKTNPLDNLTLGNLGTVGATAGSIAADVQRANDLKALNEKYMSFGAPSRDRYEASFAPGFDISKLPGLQGALDTSYQGLLRGLSTQGNPFGNPGGLTEAMKYITGNVALPALNQYRNQNAATGGFGAFSTAAPGAATGAIDASGKAYSDLGRGAETLFNPPDSLESLLRKMKSGGYSPSLA